MTIIRNLMIVIIIFLLGIAGLTYYLDSINHSFAATTFLAGLSTYVIALLTVIYVFTTSRQLNVMSDQLSEMKKSREFENQPLPWITEIKPVIEKPRFYYSPPKDDYTAQSRYRINFKIKNIGNSPAVNIDAVARIKLKGALNSYYESPSIQIHTLEEKNHFPSDAANKDEFFLFAGDGHGEVINKLRESEKDLPIVELEIYYKNILGGWSYPVSVDTLS